MKLTWKGDQPVELMPLPHLDFDHPIISLLVAHNEDEFQLWIGRVHVLLDEIQHEQYVFVGCSRQITDRELDNEKCRGAISPRWVFHEVFALAQPERCVFTAKVQQR